MVNLFIKRPILISISLSLLLFLTAGLFWEAIVTAHFSMFLFLFVLSGKDFYERIAYLLCSLLCFIIYLTLTQSPIVFLFGELLCLSIVCYTHKNLKNIFSFGLIASAFFIHLYYIQQTPIEIRQHDLNGIYIYMNLITKEGINWFNFNPWHMYYLFHQPLHFIIAGYFYILELELWRSSALAAEGLQYLSLFYVTGTTVCILAIFTELKLSGISLYTAILLTIFNPTLTLFSGFISNDTPVLFWSVLTIYLLLRWYNTDSISALLYAAITFGLATLTKLSILMIVPAISFLFLLKLVNTKNRKDCLSHICLFIIVAVPLSLLWIVRNHILFDMQFYNLPDTSPAGQNFKHLTFFERIGDFSKFLFPFIKAPIIVDNNPILSLIKTELFGEWDYPSLYYPALFLYLLTISFKIIALLSIINILFHRDARQPLTLFFIVLYLSISFYSFKYVMDFPYVCSSNYRYFALLMVPETFFISKYRYQLPIFYSAILYACFSVGIYLAI